MKMVRLTILLALCILFAGCDASASDAEGQASESKIDKSAVTELQIDEQIQVENGDADVAKFSEEAITELVDATGTVDMGADMTMFTPEDIALLDNLTNQDWLFKEEPVWMMRFEDDVLIIGEDKGQVTDVLKYHITSMDHASETLVLHVVERVDEYSGIDGSKLNVSYYCQVIITGDDLTYVNKMNSPNQMTQTVWMRKK